MSFEAPKVTEMRTQADAIATAGNDGQSVIGEAPFAGTVTAVYYITVSAITGATTNNRTVSITNRGQAGAGTTSVATLTFINAVNTVKDDPCVIPLSGTPANLVVAQGDVLTFDSVHNASGIADPGGVVVVEVSRS